MRINFAILPTWLTVLFTIFPISIAFEVDGLEEANCEYKQTATELDADVIIGAVFPLQGLKVKMYDYDPKAITWVESFLLAVDQINKNKTLLPGVKLGYDIRNSCGNQELALQHTLDFMINTDYYEPLKSEKRTSLSIFGNMTYLNDSEPSNGMCRCKTNLKHKVAAVIGDYTSQLSESMSNLLSTDYLPQISYGATSPTLGNKTIYKSFLRTLPSDLHQTKAIADLLYRYNWTYVSAFASDDNYGRTALDILRDELKEKGICLAIERTFDSRFPGQELEEIIREIKKKQDKTNVVILYCDAIPAERIIKEAYKASLTNITWIGTEQWGTDTTITNMKSPYQNLSIISLKLRDENVPELKHHMETMKRESQFNNPWLEPFWLSLGFCSKNKTLHTEYCINMDPEGTILPLDKHFSVMASVYSVAHGLHRLFNCQTKNGTGTCPDKDKPFNYKDLFHNIKNSSFMIPTATDAFTFDKNGDAAFSSYIYFSLREEWKLHRRKWKWKKKFQEIGTWNGADQSMKVENYTTEWSKNKTKVTATCSFPCNPGFYIINSIVSCCWQCVQCGKDEVSTSRNQITCKTCSYTQISNPQHTKCLDLQNKNLSLTRDYQGMVLAIFALIGVVLTTMTLVIFLLNWNSPIVKSSSREMSLIQIFSIDFLFCFPFLHMIGTNKVTCVARTMFLGLLYAQILAFIAVKTYRLLRVFNKKRFTKISKFLQTKYQVMASLTIVFIELIVLVIWFCVHPPHIAVYKDTIKQTYVEYCGATEDILNYAVIGYIFFLSLVSGFMAFKARSLPENFNEAQFIWFAMFTTCLAWLLSLPLYFSLDRITKPVVLIAISLVSNFCLLGFLYGYKIYIILFAPQLNTVAHFRKMATNATVTTFLKEVDPTGVQRPREQSVISFDFDGMFDEYRERIKHTSISLPTRKLTIKLRKSRIHFPSGKKKSVKDATPKTKRRKRNKKSELKSRTKTVQLPKEYKIPIIQRSWSLDEIKLRKERVPDVRELFPPNVANDDNARPFKLTRRQVKSEAFTENEIKFLAEINGTTQNKDLPDVFQNKNKSEHVPSRVPLREPAANMKDTVAHTKGKVPSCNTNSEQIASNNILRDTKKDSIDSNGLFSPVSVTTELIPRQKTVKSNEGLIFSFTGRETFL